ncbi:tyrosine-protein phosphatase [Nocardia sp. CDC159]|uniref:Tyrosine-protein phosphatase n=1 Tax=Nocardia pulmonis TaxID=2951408 RepID=A0A9X2E387_9NOCA|nr:MULTISPECIES: tyrosine-protein phosphatase [Nocardia]MCM6773429.1 tyrosine-protein phosphatase [Nocardia pulmonis]MCM6786316.1 tyrosine-protein phosphatase [Nocardia sp. CDC159]
MTATSVTAQPEVQLAAGGKIDLQGAVNTRDIGGYRTYDGKTVRSGKAIRSDSLQSLTEADVQKLAALRLKQVIDLRTPQEVQFLGADKLPAGVPLVARPTSDTGMFLLMLQLIQSRDYARQEATLGNGGAERIMQNMYVSLATDPDTKAKVGQTIRDLANTDRPTLFHCTAGKDRTGWVTYIALRAVGVPEQTARQDYLKSNEYRAAADARLREQVRQAGLMQHPDLLIPLQEVRDAYLDTALSRIGDFGRYLTDGLGLDPGTILKLRRNLVG